MSAFLCSALRNQWRLAGIVEMDSGSIQKFSKMKPVNKAEAYDLGYVCRHGTKRHDVSFTCLLFGALRCTGAYGLPLDQ